jgi:hypothetical protein
MAGTPRKTRSQSWATADAAPPRMPPWLTPLKVRFCWSSTGVPSGAWNAGSDEKPRGSFISRPRNSTSIIDCWRRSGMVRKADMSTRAAATGPRSSSDMPIHQVAQVVTLATRA